MRSSGVTRRPRSFGTAWMRLAQFSKRAVALSEGSIELREHEVALGLEAISKHVRDLRRGFPRFSRRPCRTYTSLLSCCHIFDPHLLRCGAARGADLRWGRLGPAAFKKVADEARLVTDD